MADKMTCPGCGVHASDVLRAYRDGRPCPCCGLSCTATEEILRVRRTQADRDLQERYQHLLVGYDRLVAKHARLARKVRDIQAAVEMIDPDDLDPTTGNGEAEENTDG